MRRSSFLPRILAGFIAGFLAVLVFHQGMVALLHIIGALSHGPYSMQPVPPLGIPHVWDAAFWGGVWGIAFVLIVP
jgi:hypothetical protein